MMVPRLRFPEFREAGEWSMEPLGDKTIKIGSGITPNGGDKNYKNEGRPFVRSQNIGWGSLLLNDIAFIDEATHATFPSTEIEEDDVLLNITGASIGRSAVADLRIKGGNVNQHVCIIRTRKNKLSAFYLNQYLLSNSGQSQIDSFQAGGNRQGLNFAQIRSLVVPFPPQIEEQQKIADCLSSLDDLIAAQSQKLDALKTHKKGLMQQLFPAEGETVPRLRFPEFRDAGKWECRKLGELIEIKGRIGYRGYTVEDIVKKGEGAIALSPSNIDDTGLLLFENSTYISWYKYEESPEIMLEKGFTILVKTGSSYGKSALIINLPEKSTINPQLVILKPIRINSMFLSLLTSHHCVQEQIKKTVVGGAIPTLSQESISKFEVFVPNKDEQQKIADCLSSLDDLIATQRQKLDSLKAHKKGLMQQLFPNPNEIEE